MTDITPENAGKLPSADEAPPASAPPPAPAPAPAPEHPEARPGFVWMRVEPPHSEIIFGMRSVGREFTEVPERFAPGIQSAAADAGVTITQES